MTETDATRLAARDARLLLERLRSARGPEEVEAGLSDAMYYRLTGLGADPTGLEALLRRPSAAETMSGRIRDRCMAVFSVLESWQPEDARAGLLWLVGAPAAGPGIVQETMGAFPDVQTRVCATSLERAATALRQRFDGADSALFDRARTQLPSNAWRLVRSSLSAADLGHRVGDGERARDDLVLARRRARWLLARYAA